MMAEFLNIHAVYQNFSFVRIIEPAQQLDHSGLARTVPAHNGKLLTHLKLQGKVFQRIFLTSRIFERNIPKSNMIFVVASLFHGQGALIHFVGKLQQLQNSHLLPGRQA